MPTYTSPQTAPPPTSPPLNQNGPITTAPVDPSLLDWPSTFLPTTTTPTSSPSTAWLRDAFGQDPDYLAYQEELRTLIFTSAQTAACTREGTPTEGGNSTESETPDVRDSRRNDSMAGILMTGRRLEYLKAYLGQVAPWLDMFDQQRHFGIQIPMMAQKSPALLYSVLAVAARQTECKEGRTAGFDSLELYQEAIRLVTPLLLEGAAAAAGSGGGSSGSSGGGREAEEIVTICTILCVMEMMSAQARDWRRHLEGCAALFGAHGMHGFSGGVQQAVFWCYARMDLCGALISDGTQSTLIAPSKWLPPSNPPLSPSAALSLFSTQSSPDMHANSAVYLCALVCHLISRRARFDELGEQNGCTAAVFAAEWMDLWEALQRWLVERPGELVPVEGEKKAEGLFPEVLFLHWAGISSTQLYHTACILLLGMPPPKQGNRLLHEELAASVCGSAVWHAKRVCGISLTNPHHGCLNNAIQPLWVAGRLLSHRAEHGLLVKLIQSIEATTGWRTGWRILDLEGVWGYRGGRRK